MTLLEVSDRSSGPPADVQAGDASAEVATPPREFGPALYVTWVALIVLAVALIGLVVNLTLVSRLQHLAAQSGLLARFRLEVAAGTAPVGQTDSQGRLLRMATPMALLVIPSIHLKEVVEEGTTGAVLMSGPGHRRDTPFPGQGGGVPSVIMGRQAAYGGPFGRLSDLRPGATITATTGEGVSKFKVLDVRRAGDPIPPALAAGHGRLTLETATGFPFIPHGVVFVDADQTSPILPSSPSVIPLGSLPGDEQALGVDTNTVWALVFWMQAVVLLAIAAVWSWIRWGHIQTWIVFVPLLALAGYFVSNQVALLLPNLM